MSRIRYEDEPKVVEYCRLLKEQGCAIRALKPLNLLHKRNGELLFGLFEVDAHGPDGRRLLPYVVIRGNACVIVPLVRNRDTGEERFVMVRQRRTGNGQLSLEFPAGMLDRTIDDPVGVAMRELREETGLSVRREDIFALSERPLFSSVGLQDEAILYYGCVVELPAAEYRSLEGRIAGEACEGEHIVVTTMERNDAEREATSLQVILGFFLFERARASR